MLPDVDECEMEEDVCVNGECDNTLGSFMCRCEEGYSAKPDNGPGCTDDDECELGSYNCDVNADCINAPVRILHCSCEYRNINCCWISYRCLFLFNFQGSYFCRCRDGFTGNGVSCRDVNECLTNNGGCDQNAQCINTEGSFKVLYKLLLHFNSKFQ